MKFELSEDQKGLLDAQGHTLVTGGAGSGKTTIAIWKAASLSHNLRFKSQKILFLSFARPTIARVEEAIQKNSVITKNEKAAIEVETYHSFFWRILNDHGYLLGYPRPLQVLEGYNEAEILLSIREKFGGKPKQLNHKLTNQYIKEVNEAQQECAKKNGMLAFDLFAPSVAQMLYRSKRILNLISLCYPYIILDEFQDTDHDQWSVVKQLGRASTLLALGDPEQQIYRWKGADPQRLQHYISQFSPHTVDFKKANFRSAGTDIATFGNEILTEKFSKPAKNYVGIEIRYYGRPKFCNKQMAYKSLNLAIIQAKQRLLQTGNQCWSLAILTGSKDTTKKVSELMSSPPWGCAMHPHRPIFDLEAAILGAGILSSSLEQNNSIQGQEQFIRAVLRFMRGRNGDGKPKSDYVRKASEIEADFKKFKIDKNSVSKQKICIKLLDLHRMICDQSLSGDPQLDWVKVRELLEGSIDPRLRDAGKSTRFLRLLEKNTDLRSFLTNDWQANGCYQNAFKLVNDAFVQEHFVLGKKPESGIVVMNLHKSKGKEFDEVIIFDGFNSYSRETKTFFPGDFSRICFGNQRNVDTKQCLRVAITRAREKTTFLTPHFIPCALLRNLRT